MKEFYFLCFGLKQISLVIGIIICGLQSAILFTFFKFILLFCLAVPGFSCGTRDLQSSLRHVGSLAAARGV